MTTANIYVSFPAVRLTRADVIQLRGTDDDFIFRDAHNEDAAYDGWVPFQRFRVKCAGYPAAEVEPLVSAAVAKADLVLTEASTSLTTKALPTDDADLGADRAGLGRARAALTEIGGLVGWGDPRVARRVEWYSRIEARWVERAAAAFAKLQGDAVDAATFLSVGASAVTIVCGDAAIAALGPEPQPWMRAARCGFM